MKNRTSFKKGFDKRRIKTMFYKGYDNRRNTTKSLFKHNDKRRNICRDSTGRFFSPK